MNVSLLPERLENYRIINHLSKSDMANILNISNEKYSKIIHRNYTGTFTEYEEFAKKLFKTPEEKYNFFTGEHLPTSSQNTTKELELQTIGKLMQSVVTAMEKQLIELNAKMDVLIKRIEELEGGKRYVRTVESVKHPQTEHH